MLLLELEPKSQMEHDLGLHSTTAHCSLFRSLPDAWALGHPFPVMPLSGLHLKPTWRALLDDLTCDEDGRLNSFPLEEATLAVGPGLPMPPWPEQGRQAIGLFMVGAYQEVLGGLHNLFGRPHTVVVEADDRGSWRISEMLPGDKSRDLLARMAYDVDTWQVKAQRQAVGAGQDARLRRRLEASSLDESLLKALDGYAYPEPDRRFGNT